MTLPRGFLRLLLGILLAILPSPVAAQFEVNFSLSKPTYLAREPVFLNLTVKNVSIERLRLDMADPLTICSGYSLRCKEREIGRRKIAGWRR